MTLLNIKSSKISSEGRITIPEELRTEKFKEGQKVTLLVYNDRIEIRPII